MNLERLMEYEEMTHKGKKSCLGQFVYHFFSFSLPQLFPSKYYSLFSSITLIIFILHLLPMSPLSLITIKLPKGSFLFCGDVIISFLPLIGD